MEWIWQHGYLTVDCSGKGVSYEYCILNVILWLNIEASTMPCLTYYTKSLSHFLGDFLGDFLVTSGNLLFFVVSANENGSL